MAESILLWKIYYIDKERNIPDGFLVKCEKGCLNEYYWESEEDKRESTHIFFKFLQSSNCKFQGGISDTLC